MAKQEYEDWLDENDTELFEKHHWTDNGFATVAVEEIIRHFHLAGHWRVRFNPYREMYDKVVETWVDENPELLEDLYTSYLEEDEDE